METTGAKTCGPLLFRPLEESAGLALFGVMLLDIFLFEAKLLRLKGKTRSAFDCNGDIEGFLIAHSFLARRLALPPVVFSIRPDAVNDISGIS